MTQSGYLFLGLTAIVGALCGLLAFAIVKFFAAARQAARSGSLEGTETAFMAAAMEQAVGRLRDQERAMKARAEASERLSSEIIASMTSGVLVVDDRGEVQTLNPAGCALLQVAGDTTGGNYRDILKKAGGLADIVEECLTTSRPIVRRALTMPPAGGGASHLGVTASPIRDRAGAPHGAICLFTDLSEVMDLEEQLRLKDSLARLGELTAGIAHEFRNGLATIHGYSRLIDPERLPPDYRPYVTGIRAETEALGQVVTNFLNFAKPAELVRAAVDLTALIQRAADDVRADWGGQRGDVEISGEFGRVNGDEVLLRQAFSNLCRNALEACAGAGVAPRIAIHGVRDESQNALRITVTDNGPGIS